MCSREKEYVRVYTIGSIIVNIITDLIVYTLMIAYNSHPYDPIQYILYCYE